MRSSFHGLLARILVLSALILQREHQSHADSQEHATQPDIPAILTNRLHSALISKAYQATLTSAGIPEPHLWLLTGGSLPQGLELNPKTGRISGVPSSGGQFSLTVAVQRASQIVISKSFTLQVVGDEQDTYGGLTSIPCPNGPRAHFYTQKIDSRWHLCTPEGNAFWMNGVYHVAADDSGTDYQQIVLSNLINTKYRTGFTANSTLNWALQSVGRMQSWGFNTLAEYASSWTLPVAVNSSWPTPDQTIPLKLSFVAFTAPSHDSMSNTGDYAMGPVKDLMAGVKTAVYQGYRSQSVDYWDPRFAQYFQNGLAMDHWMQQAIKGPHHEYMIGIVVDDTDNLQGFGAGADFPTVSNGLVAPGYNQPHLGWIILVTAPAQTANTSFGVTYSDTTVYAKLELSSWLSARYSGSIASLNAAWGSQYTTFGSAGGFGLGTGVLDEDGTCPAKGSHTCWVPSEAFAFNGAAAAIRRDLDDFLFHHAQKYFSTVKGVLQAQAPGVLYAGPTVLGTWGSPPRRQILLAAAPYVDMLDVPTLPSMCSNCTDLQQRVDFMAKYGGDKPWVSWEGYRAQADSYMSPWASSTDQFTTQAARGQAYQQRMRQLLNSTDTPTGTYHLVGLKWWSMYDDRGENANWGLITRRDNPYDAESATTTIGADSWGYPTSCLPPFGCERHGYGDFIDAVHSANLSPFQVLFSERHPGPRPSHLPGVTDTGRQRLPRLR